MNIYFLTIANIIFNDVCFRLGDHTTVLPLPVTLILIIVAIGAYKKRVIASHTKPRKRASLGFAGTCIDDLNDLIEADRPGVYFCKARQNRCHTKGRE